MFHKLLRGPATKKGDDRAVLFTTLNRNTDKMYKQYEQMTTW